MAHPSEIYRFPVFRDYRFRIGGKKCRLGRGGVRALTLLAHIVQQTPDRDDIAWLLPLRSHIRELERVNPRAALALVIERTDNERVRCFAIWLRGRCGGTFGTSSVSRFCTSSDRAIRKETARCLRRLGAWAELRNIAAGDPDPRIRRIATPSPSQPYAIRLATFSQHIPRRLTVRRKSELFVAPEVGVRQRHPPKPRWLIRMILERIHRLVTGSNR